MKFSLERLTNPDIEPLTLAEMKRHLRAYADVTTEDPDITGLIVAAREWVEDYTARALIDQKWRLSIDGSLYDRVSGVNMPPFSFGSGRLEWLRWMRRGEILLHRAPILAITSFVTVDAAGEETAVDSGSYALHEPNSKWPRILPLNGIIWPVGGLKIEYRAGFADRLGSPKQDASVVPTRFRQAMKLWAEANYDRDPVMMPLLLKVAAEIVQPERANLSIA